MNLLHGTGAHLSHGPLPSPAPPITSILYPLPLFLLPPLSSHLPSSLTHPVTFRGCPPAPGEPGEGALKLSALPGWLPTSVSPMPSTSSPTVSLVSWVMGLAVCSTKAYWAGTTCRR